MVGKKVGGGIVFHPKGNWAITEGDGVIMWQKQSPDHNAP